MSKKTGGKPEKTAAKPGRQVEPLELDDDELEQVSGGVGGTLPTDSFRRIGRATYDATSPDRVARVAFDATSPDRVARVALDGPLGGRGARGL